MDKLITYVGLDVHKVIENNIIWTIRVKLSRWCGQVQRYKFSSGGRRFDMVLKAPPP
jgi:hypothetical protein